MSNQLCSNYATALFDLIDHSKANDYKIALKEISNLFKNDEKVFKLLCAYGLDKKITDSIIDSICSQFNLEYLDKFMMLLNKKHRIAHFNEIEREFSHLANNYLGIEEGYIYSSEKIGDLQLKSIEKALENKLSTKVELHNIIDSSLIGGVKVSIKGKVYDNSLKGGIDKLTKSLLGGN